MSSRRSWVPAGALCVAALCAAALSGCGGGHQATTPLLHGGQETVDIYASLPLEGPARPEMKQVLNGINLASEGFHGTAGFYTIHFRKLNDAGADGKPDPAIVASNAMQVADDPNAVLYIGDWASAASEVSIPILNQAGVPQLSPASTYIGLTSALPGITAPSEPPRYYPSQTRTFLRLVPPDSVEAEAVETALKQRFRCQRVGLAHDSEPDGGSVLAALIARPTSGGVNVISETAATPDSPAFAGWLASLKRLGVDCVIYAGDLTDGGSSVPAEVHRELPGAKILGTDGVCTDAWASSLPTSADSSLSCTAPAPSLSATAAGRTFLELYRAKYHTSSPDPAAVYGYEAMRLGLDTIAALGAQGNIKADVLSALFATRGRISPIGTYGFNRNGEITLGSYGLYQFKGGAPVFYQSLTPSRVP